MNICTEFEEPMSFLCQVIIWTRFGLHIIKLKVTVTLTFDGLISKSIGIIYTPETNVCAKFDKPRSVLCLVIMQTRFGLYINIMMVTVPLTFDILTSKSKGFISTPRQMSVPNLMNLCQFCVVIIQKRFGLYTNMLMVSVTLTFDRLSSKLIGNTYTPIKTSVLNLTNLGQFCL